METEKWINEILNSTNGMTKVVPDEMLFSKIQNKIRHENTLPNPWIWAAAASFAVLISLNIKFVFSNSDKTNSQTELLASSITKTNQLY
ncbi:hypothetical protein [Flavobacterium sp. GT3R68]|uniref:hypothetical protein n=1 Tax=Flavobacterium sp. GT3R68 TaxID=2594437 RepID=UPI000F8702D2|nr:hypothetical protein [Flavobacterium sp. GT3R68]RTY93685.1 hypothetical protein EKL32_15280 [Flavobacterium sp. GSN2]TRW91593.1 hypothetical protein FNW07_06805 [Flavobacterium sp. GT3R68]